MNRNARQLLMVVTLAALSAGGALFAQTQPQDKPQKISEAALPKTQYWFGVAVENIPPVIAKQLKLRKDQGLMVVQVLPNSPAEKAGLKADDLLIKINDTVLTSQEDLAHAANNVKDKTSGGEVQPRVSRITYLREGDPAETDIMPAPRPTQMLVVGNVGRNFQLNNSPETAGNAQSLSKNYVLPSGVQAQVGPGYRINLNTAEATLTNKSIKQIVSEGKTVVLTRETDANGNTTASITVGTTTYPVDPQNISKLPADLRPLAEQLIKQPPRQTNAGSGAGKSPAGAGNAAPALEERVKDLEERNKVLQDQLRQLLQKSSGGEAATQRSPSP